MNETCTHQLEYLGITNAIEVWECSCGQNRREQFLDSQP